MEKGSNPGLFLSLLTLVVEVFVAVAKIMLATVIFLNIAVWLVVLLKFGLKILGQF